MKRAETAIRPLDSANLDAFIAYVEDHLLDNGRNGTPLFHPETPSTARKTSERRAIFETGFMTPVGEPRWRRGWTAVDDAGNILGHVDLHGNPDPCAAHRAELGMGVHRDHRRRGLGRSLVDFALAWATTSTALAWVDLHFLGGNAPAERLYRSAGFREVATIEDRFRIDGRSVHDIMMTIRLRGGV